jgi:hypothetical protein
MRKLLLVVIGLFGFTLATLAQQASKKATKPSEEKNIIEKRRNS